MDRIEKMASRVVQEMTAAQDLASLKEFIPEVRKKQQEYKEREEQMQVERNKMWYEATRELHEGTEGLLLGLRDALVDYFKASGKGVRKADATGGLVEVFLGSDDGVKRYQSKVSCSIYLTFEGRESATFKMRNEALDDVDLTLSDKSTVAKMMQTVKAADKKGFWDLSGE